ncbi:MAG: hypothetical protein Q7N87_01795 [Candidatus Uhrbacteria bacterium]|nr:hypothetical protein [Candidatus Uhrbacteria bacterium]
MDNPIRILKATARMRKRIDGMLRSGTIPREEAQRIIERTTCNIIDRRVFDGGWFDNGWWWHL